MITEFIIEPKLQPADKAQIVSLLQRVFQQSDYGGRAYFKQLPHYRWLAKKNNMVVGHVAMDYRVMNMQGVPIKVLGVIDLVVDPAYRNKGIGKQLMQHVETTANEIKDNVDFIFLVTDVPGYYAQLGYSSIPLTTTWLKLYNHKNYGVGEERIADSKFMIKPIGNMQWQGEELDLLGYMY